MPQSDQRYLRVIFAPPELFDSRKAVQVVRAAPHSPPPVASGAEPPAQPVRALEAMVSLHRAVVDQRPAPHVLGDEARVTVAGLGHRAHGARVDRSRIGPHGDPDIGDPIPPRMARGSDD